MSEVRIAAEPRTEFGKGAARRVRRAAKVPAVLYGHGEDPRHLSLPGHDLMLALKKDANVLLTLELTDGEELALPRAVVRDPIKGFLEHIDLILVRKGEKVSVEVPLVLEGSAVGETLVQQEWTTLRVTVDATAIPSQFTLDIDGLEVGDSHTAGSIQMPEGCELELDPETVVVIGQSPVVEAEPEADEDGEGEDGEAAAEGGGDAEASGDGDSDDS